MSLHPPRPEPTELASTSPAATLPPSQYWPRRFILVGLCFLSTFVCYIDRVNMSVAIIPMAEEFKWDQTTKGIVLSSFFYGYLATQVLGGWLADRYGGKVVLGFGVLKTDEKRWMSKSRFATCPYQLLPFREPDGLEGPC